MTHATRAFLSALRASLHDEQPRQPTTLSAASAAVRSWLAGTGPRPLETLRTLRDVVLAAHAAGDADLSGADALDPVLRTSAQRVQRATAEVADALHLVGAAVERDQRDVLTFLLERLEAAADDVRQARADLDAWRFDEGPTCPRCGARPEDLGDCASCGAAVLIPDPRDDEVDMLVLGPACVRLYRACDAVARGRAPLGELLDAAAVVERDATHAFWQLESDGDASLDEVRRHLSDISAGAARIRDFVDTRMVRDLNEGWTQVARAAAALQPLVLSAMADVTG